MSIIEQISEAVIRFKMQGGGEPKFLYLGTAMNKKFEKEIRGYVQYSAPKCPEIYGQCPVFRGMKLLTVLGEPEHLGVR